MTKRPLVGSGEPLRLLLDGDMSTRGPTRFLTRSGFDVISFVPTNAFGEMERRFARCFELYPTQADWIDRAVIL